MATSLFYPIAIARQELVSLVHGLKSIEELGLDVLAFAEPPGPLDRELAVPLLLGMDEVVVTEAQLRLRARSRDQEITTWTTSRTSGADAGIVLALAAPGRLRRIVMDAPTFSAGMPAADLHLVVRAATPRPGGGFTLGPPIFADPPFSLPSPMYAPILGGLTVATVSGGRRQLTFPRTAGSAWLIQYATGNEAAKLTAVDFTSTVRSVTVDAVPSDVTVALAADGDAEEVTLWSHPGPLLPDAGTQEVAFTPLAQRRLSARLASAAGGPTLPVSLRLSSSTAGDLVVVGSALSARYRVKPLASDPLTLTLGGGWSDLALRAPAGRRPAEGALRVGVRHLGRELNAGSPEPPRTLPAGGVRVDADHWAAVAIPVTPPGPGPTPIVGARLALAASTPSEVVAELRGGGAGGPGPALAAPVVVQLEPGAGGWQELGLASALELPPEQPAVWVVLRTTRGAVRWFAGAGGAEDTRVSLDHGATWGDVEPALGPFGAPLAGLLHRLDGELPLPGVRAELAGAQVSGDLLAGAERIGAATFAIDPLALPFAVLNALGATVGAPGTRVDTILNLFSTAVAELTLSAAALTYDPAGG